MKNFQKVLAFLVIISIIFFVRPSDAAEAQYKNYIAINKSFQTVCSWVENNPRKICEFCDMVWLESRGDNIIKVKKTTAIDTYILEVQTIKIEEGKYEVKLVNVEKGGLVYYHGMIEVYSRNSQIYLSMDTQLKISNNVLPIILKLDMRNNTNYALLQIKRSIETEQTFQKLALEGGG